MNKTVRIILIVLCVAVFLVSAFFLGRYLLNSLQTRNQFDELAQIKDQATEPTEPSGGEEQNFSEPVQAEDPEIEEPPQILPEYAQLYEMNNDMVGWITIENTVIDYPVMQRRAEKDYYLYRDFYGEDNIHGCIYVREQCDVFTPSDNVVIYGHRMKDGSMFRQLLEYEDRSFYEEHSTITFNTLYETHTYQIIAVFKTTMDYKGFAFHHFDDAQDEAQFDEYVVKCMELALYDTGETAVYGDKLITLATCEYSAYAGRMVIVAKRIS